MNVTTGEVIAERIARSDSAAFISFLSLPGQSIPPGLPHDGNAQSPKPSQELVRLR